MFAVLHHPNIVKCVGVTLQAEQLLILLELMQCDLKSYLKRTISVSTSQLFHAALQIANAMAYLSSLRIIHRDLAARNVLVSTSGIQTVKLNDFGLSRTLSTSQYYKKASNDKIPVKWMAPESIIDRKYSSASDVWSFAVFCWELFEHAKTPYPGIAVDGVVTFVLRGNRMAKPQECTDAMYDLMLQCWQLEPKSRPPFSAIVSMIEAMIGDDSEGESHL